MLHIMALFQVLAGGWQLLNPLSHYPFLSRDPSALLPGMLFGMPMNDSHVSSDWHGANYLLLLQCRFSDESR